MKYFYQGRTKEGKIQSGVIEASSHEAAGALLQKYDLYVTSLKELKSKNLFLIKRIKLFQRVNKKDLAIFSRQLAIMLNSRVPVVQSLSILASQITKPRLKERIMRVSGLVEEGSSLSEAFSYYPEVFDVFYVSIIKTGESSGKISETLYYLSEHLEREYDTMAQLRSAMVYPIFVLVVLGITIGIILFGVMPGFVEILEETEVEIPFITRMMLNFYHFFLNFGWILIIGFAGLIAFIIYYSRTEEGKKIYDKFSLKLPFIGGFLKKVFLIRFSENTSTLVASGVSITQSLRITQDVIGNFVYKNIVSETERKVSQGEKISTVLLRYPEVVPAFVSQMIKVGEDTGKLDKTLMEIVNFYRKEIERNVETFISLVEPILIVFLGAIVGVLAFAVFMPLYGIIGEV